MKFALPSIFLSLALSASASAQIHINQFYNFDNTTITTDSLGRWSVPVQAPSSPGAVQGQYFVDHVTYNLFGTSTISCDVLNDTGAVATAVYDPTGEMGPVQGGAPSPVVGTIGERMEQLSVANGATATLSYSETVSITTSFPTPAFDFSNPVSYDTFTLQPMLSGAPISLTDASGSTVVSFGKADARVSNFTESCTLNGTIFVRYVFVPGNFQTVCDTGNAELGFFSPQPQTAEVAVLGLQGITPDAPAVFLYSTTPAPMSSIGLCLGNPLRMNGPGVNSNVKGTLIRTLEASGTFLAGQTYYFQAWYRASVAGQPVAQFSDSISVVLQ